MRNNLFHTLPQFDLFGAGSFRNIPGTRVLAPKCKPTLPVFLFNVCRLPTIAYRDPFLRSPIEIPRQHLLTGEASDMSHPPPAPCSSISRGTTLPTAVPTPPLGRGRSLPGTSLLTFTHVSLFDGDFSPRRRMYSSDPPRAIRFRH